MGAAVRTQALAWTRACAFVISLLIAVCLNHLRVEKKNPFRKSLESRWYVCYSQARTLAE